MKYTMKKMAAVGLAGVIAMSSLTGCGSFDNDAVVAMVGKEEITAGMANFVVRMQQAQFETYYAGMMGTTGEEMWSQPVDDKGKTYEDSVKEGMITSLENLYLLRQHAAEYKVELTKDEKKKIEKAAAKFDEDNTLEDKEAVSGYKKYVEEYLSLVTIQKKMEAPMKEGVNKEVSDEEAAQKAMQYVFFPYSKADENGQKIDMSKEEKAQQKEKAEKFAAEVKDAKDFKAVAEKSGVKVQSATFDKESATPDAALVKAVDELKKAGEVTSLIESDYGLYVGTLTSLLDRKATDEKKKSIVEERKQKQFNNLIEAWRKDTVIKVNKKVWSGIDFSELGVTMKEGAKQYQDAPAAE